MLIIDPMHNLYLGTAKNTFALWRKKGIIIDVDVRIINNRISKLHVPSNVSFSCLPSSIETSTFTAEQWMVWVNYYSLYCLYGILPSDHMECWRHFVLASRLLSRHRLNTNDLTLGDALLLQFCRRFQSINGHEAVKPNMHLHCHLVDCMRDFGPMASFWLFSFERYNGLLGNQPTNNRSIEIQLMQRFTDDNARLHLLRLASCEPKGSNATSDIFHDAIIKQVNSFDSVRHLDTSLVKRTCFSSGFQCIPACKFTIAAFSDPQMEVLSKIYSVVYPSQPIVYLPRSYRKLQSVSINDQLFCAGQYVLAKFVIHPTSGSSAIIRTAFSNSSLYPTKIHHFALHSCSVEQSH